MWCQQHPPVLPSLQTLSPLYRCNSRLLEVHDIFVIAVVSNLTILVEGQTPSRESSAAAVAPLLHSKISFGVREYWDNRREQP